jgi:hypothetical protein
MLSPGRSADLLTISTNTDQHRQRKNLLLYERVMHMTDKTTTASTSTDASGIRLKKDGTPDRRGGKIGNKGNRHATGRKALPGYEKRKMIAVTANEKEYKLLLDFARLLKHGEPSIYKDVLAKLGTPPAGRAKKGEGRKRYTLAATEEEKQIIKDVIQIIKDRYESSYIIISGAVK